MKKYLSILLTISFVLSFCIPTFAAQDASGPGGSAGTLRGSIRSVKQSTVRTITHTTTVDNRVCSNLGGNLRILNGGTAICDNTKWGGSLILSYAHSFGISSESPNYSAKLHVDGWHQVQISGTVINTIYTSADYL